MPDVTVEALDTRKDQGVIAGEDVVKRRDAAANAGDLGIPERYNAA